MGNEQKWNTAKDLEKSFDEDFFKEKVDEIVDTLIKKNHDYGNSYENSRDKYGHVSFLIRLSDKLGRYGVLAQNDAKIVTESLEDTLNDMIGYVLLELKYLEERK